MLFFSPSSFGQNLQQRNESMNHIKSPWAWYWLTVKWRMRIQWDSHSAHSTLNTSSDIPRLHLCLMRLQCVVHVLRARSKSLAQVFIVIIIIFLISYWSFAWVTLPPGRNSRKWSGCFADEVFEGRNDIKKKKKKNCMANHVLFFIV